MAITLAVMLLFGQLISSWYNGQVAAATMPLFTGSNTCSAAFLYALTFLTCNKMLSTFCG